MNIANALKDYHNLSKEVQDFSLEIEKNQDIINSITTEYKGFQIMYSDLKINPPFLFIGMNPGAGYYKDQNHQNVMNFGLSNRMDYCQENYKLAQATRSLFTKSEFDVQVLDKCCKTNFYFISTTGEKHLNSIIKKLDPLDFEKKSKNWNKRLIEIIKPQRIICESIYAFRKVIEEKEIKAEYFSNTMYAKWDEIEILGYKRHGSRIRNEKETIQFLNRFH